MTVSEKSDVDESSRSNEDGVADCDVFADSSNPTAQDPASCPGLPTQQSIVPAAADDEVPSGATVIRNDTVTMDATSSRAIAVARVLIQKSLGSDFTRSGPFEESTPTH